MRPADPSRDPALGRALRRAAAVVDPPAERLRLLNDRILLAAGPMLDARAAQNRTVWEYAERWSNMLLPLGALAAVAASLCLFMLSNTREPEAVPAAAPRVALLDAATNRMTSQHLVDLIVAGDGSVGRRSER